MNHSIRVPPQPLERSSIALLVGDSASRTPGGGPQAFGTATTAYRLCHKPPRVDDDGLRFNGVAALLSRPYAATAEARASACCERNASAWAVESEELAEEIFHLWRATPPTSRVVMSAGAHKEFATKQYVNCRGHYRAQHSDVRCTVPTDIEAPAVATSRRERPRRTRLVVATRRKPAAARGRGRASSQKDTQGAFRGGSVRTHRR